LSDGDQSRVVGADHRVTGRASCCVLADLIAQSRGMKVLSETVHGRAHPEKRLLCIRATVVEEVAQRHVRADDPVCIDSP
ncbi:hypothetical protein ACWDRX_36670, partial [Streptomyces nigra]